MRITIIAEDSAVYVEEQALTVDLTGLDPDIHAVQWYGEVGEVEYKYFPITNTRAPNARFTDFAPYQTFVDRWMLVAQANDHVTAAAVAAAEPVTPVAMNVIA